MVTGTKEVEALTADIVELDFNLVHKEGLSHVQMF